MVYKAAIGSVINGFITLLFDDIVRFSLFLKQECSSGLPNITSRNSVYAIL
jgi:hypothetical protein